jgi:glycosyltransferase involved in cell wall biosynthesis
LLFVVQRYGDEIAGGAEAACRMVAERLVSRGHLIDVVTSCALRYTDWANHFVPGVSTLNGVKVHRLSVTEGRQHDRFDRINGQLLHRQAPTPLALQEMWARLEGPYLPQLASWLRSSAARFDAIVFYTYLYPPTIFGLPAAAGLAPVIFQPTAHDEPPFHLSLFDSVFRHADALAFFTPEEESLVRERFHIASPGLVTGIGIDITDCTDAHRFRARYVPDGSPYLLYLGRVDPMKGSLEGYEFFVAYKRRNPGPLRLVVVGEQVHQLPKHPDVVCTGFVDEQTKRDGLNGALALFQPSYFESFSIVLCEAFVQRVPGLVQGHSAVLTGQARRSGGALPYRGFAEFETLLSELENGPKLRAALGERGRQYVEREYRWPVVCERYESLVAQAKDAFARRQLSSGGAGRRPKTAQS